MALTEPDPGNEDVVDLLIAQHQQVKNLFARLHTATGDAAEEPFHELRKMLAVHETAEEEVIYPVLRSHGADDIVEARLGEEADAKQALANLEKMGPTAAQFPAELASFEKAVLAQEVGQGAQRLRRSRHLVRPDPTWATRLEQGGNGRTVRGGSAGRSRRRRERARSSAGNRRGPR